MHSTAKNHPLQKSADKSALSRRTKFISKYIKRYQKDSQAGFTFIELLVVTSLSVLIMMAGSGLFISSLYSSSKKSVLTTLKDEGDYSLSQMEFLLRNSLQVVANPAGGAVICTTGMNNISLRSIDNNITTFSTTNGRIASKSATAANPVYLTTTAVEFATPLQFDCYQSADGGKYIRISFSLRKQGTGVGNPTPLTEDFTTSVQTRN